MPAQILCFLELDDDQAMSGEQPEKGCYAVVWSFREEPKSFPPSILVKRGVLSDDYYVYPCSSICGTAAVVRNETESQIENDFFVVSNKVHWLLKFHEMLESCETFVDEDSDDDEEEYIDEEEEEEEEEEADLP